MATATIKQIPLNKLVNSPKNVRKTPASEADDAELYASLRYQGLKHNLLVHSVGDTFHVHAGGRRLEQLQKLAEEGHIKSDEKISCKVEPQSAAEETSVAENMIRSAMHPADEFEAFADLIEKGRSVEEVATRFGVTAGLVERRLKLAQVAPEILDDFRQGQLTLEAVMAFTLSNDHARQLEIREAISHFHPTGKQNAIRRMLTERTCSGSTRLARYVGVDKYEKAGGNVIRDLFSDDDNVHITDIDLLEKLAIEKLERAAKKHGKGWKWSVAVLDFNYNDGLKYGRVYPEPQDLDPEIASERETLQKRLDEIETLDDEDWTDEIADEADGAGERIGEIDALEEKSAVFSDEQRAIAGCIVSLDYAGKLEVNAGLVRPEDVPVSEPEATDAESDGASTNEDADGESKAEPAIRVTPPRSETTYKAPVDPVTAARKEQGVSQALGDELRATRHQIVQAHLSADFGVAFDAMLYSMCRQTFRNGYEVTPLDISLKPAMVMASRDVLKETIAATVLEEVRGSLSLDWLQKELPEDFEALCALSSEEKQALFAWCAAYALTQQLSTDKSVNPIFEQIGQRMDVDVAKFWRPTVETYWGRVKKDHSLDVARELIGDEWVNDRSHYKKALLAKSMEAYFGDDAGKKVDLGADVAAKTSTWLPDGMGFAVEGTGTAAESGATDTDPEAPGSEEAKEEADTLPAFLSEAAE
ncbi:ParB/Srx family N-terminal domain-containing protein [Nitratireductor sp. XY-223]|uniref:ParB/RepB/Spo0J family partition protein n=1 Tax=Nitratireductor sp. XY-223 TaxID=2561926 RepID=UPI0010A9D04F|nr:ParB/Srx family N-terminal domain-containing protein [Nitratireductor sp. XY-223]